MEKLSVFNITLKYIFISMITFFVFVKSTNYYDITNNKIMYYVFSSVLLGIICSIVINFFPSIISICILIILISIIISFTTNFSFESALTAIFLSMMISLSCFAFSMFLSTIIANLPFINLSYQNPLRLLIGAIIEIFLILKLFNINRFKKGFSFLKNNEKMYTFSILGLIFSGVLIIIYSILDNNWNALARRILAFGFVLISIGTFIWIKRNITLDYQDRMKNRKIENLQKELEEKDRINNELTEEIKNLTIINHKYNSRIKAAKEEISRLAFAMKHNSNTEFSSEISEVTKLIDNLSNEYSNKINDVLKYSKPLPKTNVKGVDTILEYMKLEAAKNNIDFDLKVNCSVRDFTDKYISISDLETLIGDHIKDAIIAINHSNKPIRNITVIFDIINNCYRFTVYDSGIDFEIDTLVNLGLEATTTHKDEGGTGIGFMTTFETLEKYNASLVIDEINFKNSNFSKSINIVFDGKHEYVICSSRTEEIKKKDKSNRIILKEKKL